MPIWIIGSYDEYHKENVMTAAAVGISCDKPPAVSVSLRKATYSYANIIQRKAFTVNIPSVNYAKEADYFGISSGRNQDKFLNAKLTPVKAEFIDAPYIEEFPIIMECKLIHTLELGSHTQFIGEVVDFKIDEKVVNNDGTPDLEKINPLLYIFSTGKYNYYSIGRHIGKAFSIGKTIKEL